ncbi:acylneuraminate cytidylyltransferase family protein [Xanthobacter pseudotagetidis]|uniref:acylneuraminate cytidylyltransferase family protein n=1 Tax=Xanthobacter pseudotagetidis TaxID=3119911 RepID=UPI0037292C30
MSSADVYALVLARGGSKGLKGKNVRPLGGHPLVAWSVAAAKASKAVDRVICSTDSDEIAAVARAYGAETPFMRPAELAGDFSTDLDVFGHAVRWLADHGEHPDLMVQLRPTTPFRDPEWIDRSVTMMRADPTITCVRSVTIAERTPYKMWCKAEDGKLSPLLTLEGVPEPFNMPRQKLPPVYWHTGQLDVVRSDVILSGSMTGGRIFAIEVDADSAVDIDGIRDFQMAELLLDEAMPQAVRDAIAAGRDARVQSSEPRLSLG